VLHFIDWSNVRMHFENEQETEQAVHTNGAYTVQNTDDIVSVGRIPGRLDQIILNKWAVPRDRANVKVYNITTQSLERPMAIGYHHVCVVIPFPWNNDGVQSAAELAVSVDAMGLVLFFYSTV
jgi:hypothetical protein